MAATLLSLFGLLALLLAAIGLLRRDVVLGPAGARVRSASHLYRSAAA